MAIWRLSPTKTESPDWDLSTYRGVVIVRAENEQEARLYAMQRFTRAAARVNREQETRTCPWTQSELVACEQLVGSKYPPDGASIVLEPTRI